MQTMYEIKLEGIVLLNPKCKTDELKKERLRFNSKKASTPRHIFRVLKHHSIKRPNFAISLPYPFVKLKKNASSQVDFPK